MGQWGEPGTRSWRKIQFVQRCMTSFKGTSFKLKMPLITSNLKPDLRSKSDLRSGTHYPMITFRNQRKSRNPEVKALKVFAHEKQSVWRAFEAFDFKWAFEINPKRLKCVWKIFKRISNVWGWFQTHVWNQTFQTHFKRYLTWLVHIELLLSY